MDDIIGNAVRNSTRQPGTPAAQQPSSGSGSGPTYTDPAAWQAYQDALANIAKEKGFLYQQYGYNADGTYNANNPYGLMQQSKRAYDTGMARTKEAQDAENTAYQTGITRSNQQSGLNAVFDGKGNPTGLGLTTANPHGDFEQMLGNETDAMNAAQEDGFARGLGGKGLGAQAGSRLSFQQAGDRQSYRTQLLNQLVDSHTANQQANQGFKESMDDLQYNYGLSQYQLPIQLDQALLGYSQQGQQALGDYNNAISTGSMNDVINKILNGQFPTAGAGTTAGRPTTGKGTNGVQYLK